MPGDPILTNEFPNLAPARYDVTSEQTARYNCIAWAAGDDQRFWWPTSAGGYYWPTGAAREVSRAAFVAVFEDLGYELCDSPDLEEGWEKVVMYCRNGVPTHACRQVDGGWTSKLGDYVDIRHRDHDALEGRTYGRAEIYLRRAQSASGSTRRV